MCNESATLTINLPFQNLAQNTVKDLKSFLKSRGIPGTKGEKKHHLVSR